MKWKNFNVANGSAGAMTNRNSTSSTNGGVRSARIDLACATVSEYPRLGADAFQLTIPRQHGYAGYMVSVEAQISREFELCKRDLRNVAGVRDKSASDLAAGRVSVSVQNARSTMRGLARES